MYECVRHGVNLSFKGPQEFQRVVDWDILWWQHQCWGVGGRGGGWLNMLSFYPNGFTWYFLNLAEFHCIGWSIYHNCKCGNKWNSNVPNPKPLPVLEVKAINYVLLSYSSTLYSSLKNFTYKHLSLLIVCTYMYIYKYVLLHDELYWSST